MSYDNEIDPYEIADRVLHEIDRHGELILSQRNQVGQGRDFTPGDMFSLVSGIFTDDVVAAMYHFRAAEDVKKDRLGALEIALGLLVERGDLEGLRIPQARRELVAASR